jgi:hypothetical protein
LSQFARAPLRAGRCRPRETARGKIDSEVQEMYHLVFAISPDPNGGTQ